jgi:hypothetical protein
MDDSARVVFCGLCLPVLQLLRRNRVILIFSIKRMQAGHMRPIAGTANTGKRGLSGLRFGRILLGLALLFLSYSELGFASEFCRPGDSLWEVSSRGLPDCPHVSDGQQLELFQFQQGCWSAQPLGLLREFVSAAIGQRVVIYVHGNRMSQQELHIRAQQVYRRLVSNVRCEPICFIAFSWPSDRSGGLGNDVAIKKLRLNVDAYYLASFVQSLEFRQPIGYLGYSFGSAVICGAHHLLAGGTLNGYQLSALPTQLYQDRISLIAPAFDRQSLTAYGRYSQALVGVEKVVNLYNSIDPILKRFRFFDRNTSPIAAGFAGILDPSSTSPLNADQRIIQFDCRCIGRTHAELDYHSSSCAVYAFRNVVGQ